MHLMFVMLVRKRQKIKAEVRAVISRWHLSYFFASATTSWGPHSESHLQSSYWLVLQQPSMSISYLNCWHWFRRLARAVCLARASSLSSSESSPNVRSPYSFFSDFGFLSVSPCSASLRWLSGLKKGDGVFLYVHFLSDQGIHSCLGLSRKQQHDRPSPPSPLLDMSACPSSGPTPFVAANEPPLKGAVHCVAVENLWKSNSSECSGADHMKRQADTQKRTV